MDRRWILRPNRSLSWRAALRVYAVIGVCLMGLSLAYALHGFWPVLPFAGLELIALGAAFYLSQLRSRWREVVSIEADSLRVEKGRRRAEECWEFPSFWARVRLERSSLSWYPSRLLIACKGRQVEVGGFLSEAERTALADALSRGLRERLDEARRQQ